MDAAIQPAKALNSSDVLAEDSYVRERSTPGWRDLSYLILSDIHRLLEEVAPDFTGQVLDYGCGGAPYRPLFRNCSRYVGADMIAGPEVQIVLTPDGMTNEPDGKYHGVFSAQVLEHVEAPDAYLAEAARVLSPGGKLLLTTHGFFPEHKCPTDFYRWTSEGLEALVRSQGFEIERSFKLTSGLRGGIQFLHFVLEETRFEPRTMKGLLLRLFRRFYTLVCRPLLNACGDWMFKAGGLVPGSSPSAIYIGVGVLARKR